MKKFHIRFKTVAAATLAAAALIFVTSCSKDDGHPSEANPDTNLQSVKSIESKETQQRLRELKGMLPTVVVYNSTMEQYISLDLNNPKNFNFSSPGGGISFSGPAGSVQFVPAGGGSFTIFTTPASAGGGGGGGIVTAGNVTLEVNYVMCFNSGSESEGLDLFDFGPSGSGFSGALGIAGNFEALATGEFSDTTDVFDFFQGVVAYIAFAGTPNGNFPVVDFFEFEDDFDGNFDNKGLAYFFSFQTNNVGIFFSRTGSLNFSGGSVDFNGTYYGILGNLFNFDDDWDDADYVQVPGSGVLLCGA